MERFTEKQLQRGFVLHFTSYLFIALFKVLPDLKKNAKKLSVCGKSVSRVYLIV